MGKSNEGHIMIGIVNGKRLSILLGIIVITLGLFNSLKVNSNQALLSFSGADLNKRLDEMHGRIRVGRRAASIQSWHKIKKTAKVNDQKVISKKTTVVDNSANFIPDPAISEDLELKVTKAFIKEELAQGSFSGSARTVDGIIEEINIELPDGEMIDIFTNERMVGNVFQYQDKFSGEMKSGMFYEVKRGTYMITLANDSRYQGARFEFQVNGGVVSNDTYDAQYGYGQQNIMNELAQYPQDEYNSDAEYAAQNNDSSDESNNTNENAYSFELNNG